VSFQPESDRRETGVPSCSLRGRSRSPCSLRGCAYSGVRRVARRPPQGAAGGAPDPYDDGHVQRARETGDKYSNGLPAVQQRGRAPRRGTEHPFHEVTYRPPGCRAAPRPRHAELAERIQPYPRGTLGADRSPRAVVRLHRAPILAAVLAASASAGIPRPRSPRRLVRQSQVPQDALDHVAVSDDGDEAHPALAARAGERVDAPHMPQQRRPIPAGQTSARAHPALRRRGLATRDRGTGAPPVAVMHPSRPRNNRPTPRGVRRKHAVVAHQRKARRRDERHQAREKLLRPHHPMRLAAASRRLEPVRHRSVLAQRHPLGAHRRARHVAAQALQPRAIVRGDAHPRVQVEARVLDARPGAKPPPSGSRGAGPSAASASRMRVKVPRAAATDRSGPRSSSAPTFWMRATRAATVAARRPAHSVSAGASARSAAYCRPRGTETRRRRRARAGAG
jgi:hypothetical protein